jgi:hypothetical protein
MISVLIVHLHSLLAITVIAMGGISGTDGKPAFAEREIFGKSPRKRGNAGGGAGLGI